MSTNRIEELEKMSDCLLSSCMIKSSKSKNHKPSPQNFQTPPSPPSRHQNPLNDTKTTPPKSFKNSPSTQNDSPKSPSKMSQKQNFPISSANSSTFYQNHQNSLKFVNLQKFQNYQNLQSLQNFASFPNQSDFGSTCNFQQNLSIENFLNPQSNGQEQFQWNHQRYIDFSTQDDRASDDCKDSSSAQEADSKEESSQSQSEVEAKYGKCCQGCTQLHGDANRTCICQVPANYRFKKIGPEGCNLCGCQGCSKELEGKFHAKQKPKNVSKTTPEEKSPPPQLIPDWNTKKLEFTNLLKLFMQCESSKAGVGIPQRSYSYIMGKPENENSNANDYSLEVGNDSYINQNPNWKKTKDSKKNLKPQKKNLDNDEVKNKGETKKKSKVEYLNLPLLGTRIEIKREDKNREKPQNKKEQQSQEKLSNENQEKLKQETQEKLDQKPKEELKQESQENIEMKPQEMTQEKPEINTQEKVKEKTEEKMEEKIGEKTEEKCEVNLSTNLEIKPLNEISKEINKDSEITKPFPQAILERSSRLKKVLRSMSSAPSNPSLSDPTSTPLPGAQNASEETLNQAEESKIPSPPSAGPTILKTSPQFVQNTDQKEVKFGNSEVIEYSNEYSNSDNNAS
ncbi:unnamed protein product [Moneuplotes crassus]|uniref:Uncharacterized protein n=1 Tax=Euplotes crassus TaxID=5936 RepID=A0AAD1U347_EUPCR|nr:unnamed protein product [Moneuplotes crassus]